MADLLLGARLKMARAREHLESLHVAVEGFIRTDPYGVVAEDESDGSQRVYRIDRFAQAPLNLALIVGDVIHNARCVLDHFAQVAAEHGARAKGLVLTDDEIRQIQFPLARTPEEFGEEIDRGWLLHVEPDVVAYIKSLQPFERGQPLYAWMHPLGVVRNLSNIDKHRHLHVLGMAVTVSDLEAFVSIPGMRMIPGLPKELELGTEVLRVNLPDPLPQVNVDPKFSFSVGVENAAGEIVDRLRQVLDFIDGNVLSRATYT
jgi:hypothetical protein